MTVPQPISGVSGVGEPALSVRVLTKSDAAVVTTLLSAAAAELVGHKGAWLWERADAPFGSVSESAGVLCGVSPDAFGRTWTAFAGLIDGQMFGIAAGFLAQLHDGETLGSVRVMYVEDAARGVGLGDLLINQLTDHYRLAGCVGIDAWALPGERETKNFFEAHAFSARVLTVHQSFVGKKHIARPWEQVT